MSTMSTTQEQQNNQQLPPHSNDVEEELTRIQHALEAIYATNPTPTAAANDWWSGRQLADRYLTSFQLTSVAWMVCDRLLQDTTEGGSPMISQQRRFFAAQTLHTKCRSDVQQIPHDSLPSLRDSLVNHLTHAISQPALATRLALCVAALSVQMTWTSIVTDMLDKLSQQPIVVLQIFKVLPEECATDRLILIDEDTRFRMRDHLIASSSQVLCYARDYFTQHQNEQLVLDIWLAWIRYVPIPSNVLVDTNILETVFQSLQKMSEETAVDVLVEILRMYPSHVPGNERLVQTLLPLVLSLPLDHALQTGDEDILRGYCRIVTELGESYLSLMLDPAQQQLSHTIVHAMLKCSSIHDASIVSMTFQFWYKFVAGLEDIYDYRVRQELVDNHAPYLLQLLDKCLLHLQYPSDIDTLSDDVVDDLHRERFNIGETIEDLCRLLGGQVILERLGQNLRQSTDSWIRVEACLYALQSLNRYIPSDERTFLPSCFGLIIQSPPNIDALRFTASVTIGKYAEWLATNPEFLQPLLPYLADGLSLTKCSTAAAVAIKLLCKRIRMGDSVLQLYQQAAGKVALRDELEILEGVCQTIPEDQAAAYLPQLVQPIWGRMYTSLAGGEVKPVLAEIDRLTVVVRFLKLSRTQLLDVMKSSWGLLEAASQKFTGETMIAEKLCRLHKHALRTCGPPVYEPMLGDLMTFLVKSFDGSHSSPYLYCASICVTEFPKDGRLLNMILALSQTAFGFLKSLDDFTNHPDVVEELFYLMGRMMNFCPEPLVSSPLLLPLFQCAVVGMQLDHKDANRGTLNFLESTMNFGLSGPNHRAALEPVLTAEGQVVVTTLIRALLGELPAYCIDSGSGSIAGILFKLNELFPDLLQRWMNVALPTSIVRPSERLLGALAGSNRSEFNSAVRAFHVECERHRKLRR
jgi:transportin-3